MRKPMIAGNWKMHCPPQQAAELAGALVKSVQSEEVEVVVAPPFVSLPSVATVLKGSSIKLAAQNVSDQEKGAYTGEVSASMLKEVGVNYVIIGHSERRQLFGEDDAFINRKALQLLRCPLAVILCIGETLEEREQGLALQVCQRQLRLGLQDVSAAATSQVVIAYEPVWAIGTGRSASSQDAQDVHRGCREVLAQLYSGEVAAQMRILYGGSVKPDNIAALMQQPDIDGALVGGASLQAASFLQLINYRK